VNGEVVIPDNPILRKMFGHLVGVGVDPTTISKAINDIGGFKDNMDELRTAVVDMSKNLKELNSTMQELNKSMKGGDN
jgi:prefoldin subunit 5